MQTYENTQKIDENSIIATTDYIVDLLRDAQQDFRSDYARSLRQDAIKRIQNIDLL